MFHSQANIIHGNALLLNWNSIIDSHKCSYIIGNPPFRGYHLRTKDQTTELNSVFNGIRGAGTLDYAACWFMLAAQYIQGTKIEVAFISTDSIIQGTQNAILWKPLCERYSIKINFAYRPFKWIVDTISKANVYVVIIGFAVFNREKKKLYV